MVEWVRPLKIESPASGGTDFDSYPTELNPDDDGVNVKALSLENTNPNIILDDTTDDMLFTDDNTTFDSPLHHIAPEIVTITTNYTASRKNVILGIADASDIIVTLPPATDNLNKIYHIKNIGDTKKKLKVYGDNGETIDEKTKQDLKKKEAITIICDGTEWWIL